MMPAALIPIIAEAQVMAEIEAAKREAAKVLRNRLLWPGMNDDTVDESVSVVMAKLQKQVNASTARTHNGDQVAAWKSVATVLREAA